MSNASIKEQATRYIMNTYGERDLALVRGEGCYVYDADGKRYLDFLGGLGVNCLGHCHPKIVETLKRQAETLLHVSNLYYIEPQAKAAQLLVENSFADKVFFCNSGAEANEGVLKLIRKHAKDNVDPNRTEIIVFKDSFHGRTLATVTATRQPRYHEGFAPMMPGFKEAVFNDLDSVRAIIDDKTAGILVEPIQGEGGINNPEPGFLEGLRELADENQMLLAFDEVHTGCGRTGSFMGYQTFGVEPDAVALAKSLGGGVPIGAFMTRASLADVLCPGTHAATFGGNPLVTAVCETVLTTILEEDLPGNARRMGEYFAESLLKLGETYDNVLGVRGKGLILGMQLKEDPGPVTQDVIDSGLLTYKMANNTLRFHPPLNVESTHIDEAVGILEASLAKHAS
ncbi:MAG: aspartate aminotransferase family protein [Planctomycetota bacterium]|nr:aspartate aminotransferase family protein [Planctomycetota bacterium]